jgi:heme-binding HmuY-like protein
MAAPSTELGVPARRRTAPLALYLGFGVFLVAIGYLVASSVTRRDVPAFAVSPTTRVRAPTWERVGDTMTIDASDDAHWRFASLANGNVLPAGDTTNWTIAVQRYRVMVNGVAADAGQVPFDVVPQPSRQAFAGAESPSDSTNAALRHWYRYNFLTHLLEPNGHVYLIRDARGRMWRMEIVSYYCPGPEAGCLTIRYGPWRPAIGLPVAG